MRASICQRVALVFLTTGMGAGAFADDFSFSKVARVADATLDEVRGGFEAPAHLRASLTLDRAAYVNGERVVSISASVPDIANMSVEEATQLAAAAGTLLVQNGPNNAFDVADLGPASTVIQNTLNDQHLVTLTTIGVEVNTLGAFRDMNFQDGLRDAVTTMSGVR